MGSGLRALGRLLRERWMWWLLPMLLTLGIALALAYSAPDAPDAIPPMRYDLPPPP